MITESQLIAAGATRLSKILLSLYTNNPNLQKQLDIIFIGLDENPKKLITVIKKEITSLKRSTGFVDYYASDPLADRLDQVRLSILEDLASKSLEDALILMHSFLDLHAQTINRADDSNGAIGNVFIESCKDLGEMYHQITKPVEETTQTVFNLFTKNDYGICDDVIINFKQALGDEGLNLLYSKLKKASNIKNHSTVIQGLKDIADCQKNLEAYIDACKLNKTGFSDHDYIDIATRFIDHWKAPEALEWLGKVDIKNHVLRDRSIPLKIKALELNGNYTQAEKERVLWFELTLSPDVYGQILSNANPEFKESFKKIAIEKAFNFSEPHTAINFLTKVQEFEECAKFVYIKINNLSGDRYYTLRPVAKILQKLDPLASTLLYRKMIQPVLEGAKSRYYNYAAQDLALCSTLGYKITDWKEHVSHDIYLKQIQETHKRKVSFWPKYDLSLEKHIAKEKKHKD